METQKIRIWRISLAKCDKINQKIERLIEATMFPFLNKTEHFILKETHSKRADNNTDLLFRRVAKLILSSPIIALLHALVSPKRFCSYVIIFFKSSYIFGVNFSHGLGMLLRENGKKRT